MEEKLKTGTTTIGIKINNAIILAADRQATLGNVAAELDAIKIHKINDQIAVTIAGSAGDALAVVRFLKSHAKLFEIERESTLTAKAAVTFLANILNSNRYFPFISAFILGGFNSMPELYLTDVVGGFSEVKKFTSIGSGFQLAFGRLEQGFKETLTEEEAIKLAVDAIKVAKKRDIYTGGTEIQVIVITKSGVRELNEKEIKKYAQ